MAKLLVKNWKEAAVLTEQHYYELKTEDIGDVPVRLFFTPQLLAEADDSLYAQIVGATRFPQVKMVVITPDAHAGQSVPVGSVILTEGTVAMGPVGFDIGCGMLSARSSVPVEAATPKKRLEFNREVTERVPMGATGGIRTGMTKTVMREFEELVRGGASRYIEKFQTSLDHSRAERNCIPVDDKWQVPWGGRGRPERGITQLGSLGGGNHFIELQGCEQTNTLFIQAHTGSRGFGHGLATHYFELAHAENANLKYIDLGFFTPQSRHYHDYLNAVAAAANYAIINRLMIFEEIARAFYKVFRAELELIYEISHNLVQRETHPEFGAVFVHRKGATRAFPSGHPELQGTEWQERGHPILIPGSNKDYSYILRPLAAAVNSGYSVNHGAGRKLSRGQAEQKLEQRVVDKQYKMAGIVVNTDGHVPLDEASACYKSSEAVVEAVVEAGLAEIEYKLWPLASLKGSD
jgi:tRNA-splicing ligase RtcB